MKKGFTIIEIIIAVGLFSIVATIAVGALLNLLNANSRSQTLASVLTNLNYSIESMARTIRFSTVFHCGAGGTLTQERSCNSGYGPGGTTDIYLAVSNGAAPVTIYRYLNQRIEISTDGGSTFTPLTSTEVTIDYVRFYTFNTTVGDGNQPYVMIVIRGHAGRRTSEESTFDIQTTISQRGLDI